MSLFNQSDNIPDSVFAKATQAHSTKANHKSPCRGRAKLPKSDNIPDMSLFCQVDDIVREVGSS
jgi:hypothetical protein